MRGIGVLFLGLLMCRSVRGSAASSAATFSTLSLTSANCFRAGLASGSISWRTSRRIRSCVAASARDFSLGGPGTLSTVPPGQRQRTQFGVHCPLQARGGGEAIKRVQAFKFETFCRGQETLSKKWDGLTGGYREARCSSSRGDCMCLFLTKGLLISVRIRNRVRLLQTSLVRTIQLKNDPHFYIYTDERPT